MKKYKAIVKTTQYWEKVITIKDEDIAKEEANNNFYETHYKNFDNSWTEQAPEDYEVIEVEEVTYE
tara:strand:+ start:392 stop:589 length:198 start_codon:yes stop_codon:yes gene_type:complete